MDKIRHASIEELVAVSGMNSAAAESVKAHLE
jgi:excinuclease UvrABC nuclease subunit